MEPASVSTANDLLPPPANSDDRLLHALNVSPTTNSSRSSISASRSSTSLVPPPKKIPPILPSVRGVSSPPSVASPKTLRPKRGRPVGRPPTQEILQGRRKVNFAQPELVAMLVFSSQETFIQSDTET